MDRFIEDMGVCLEMSGSFKIQYGQIYRSAVVAYIALFGYLKSNMDRFIDAHGEAVFQILPNLKSNMDRFIDAVLRLFLND